MYQVNNQKQSKKIICNLSTTDKESTAAVYSFHSELSKVEELSRMLKETQQRLNEASSELHNICMYVHVIT